jgi:hypothetical protein
MTAANHMLAGAVVAVGIQHPLLIAPIAILSHFVLDAMPHFGVHTHDAAKRNQHPLFRFMLVVDIAMTVALLLLLPSVLQGMVSHWVLIWGMCLAFLPDVVWVYHFFHGLRHSYQPKKKNWVSRFHSRIQWGERSWGVFIEIVFFAAMGVLLGAMAA